MITKRYYKVNRTIQNLFCDILGNAKSQNVGRKM